MHAGRQFRRHSYLGPALDNWQAYSLCSRADTVAEVQGFAIRKIFEILVCRGWVLEHFSTTSLLCKLVCHHSLDVENK